MAVAPVLALFCHGPAKADVSYDYVITSYTGGVVMQNGITNDGSAFTGFPLTLTFTAAGVQSGEVSGFEVAGFPTQVSGLTGFTSLATYNDSATVGNLYGSLALDVSFGAQGQITASSIQFQGADISFDIENGVAAFGSDGVLGCTATMDSGACATVGYFAAVPEPASAGLLLASLLGVVGIATWGRRAG